MACLRFITCWLWKLREGVEPTILSVHICKMGLMMIRAPTFSSWPGCCEEQVCESVINYKVLQHRELINTFDNDNTNQSLLKEINPEYSLEGLMWSWSSNTSATWYKELTHWKRPWCWERLKVGGEGDDKGWDGCMASPTQQTRVWASSRREQRTGKPGMLSKDSDTT